MKHKEQPEYTPKCKKVKANRKQITQYHEPQPNKKLKSKTPQLYIYIFIYIYFCFFFFKKGEQLFKTNWAGWWGWGAVLQKGGPEIPPGTKNKHNTKKITTNAPEWVRSLQRTDCPILKLAFFFFFFYFFLFFLFSSFVVVVLAPVQ